MTVPITVTIPVGPFPSNVRWLGECYESVLKQTNPPDEILFIDDGADLDEDDYPEAEIWKTPWHSGVAHSFNFGVALARNDLVFMLGSDDKLLPKCLERCWEEWTRLKDRLGYYYVPVVYEDGRTQNIACNAAMVHKDLWKLTGGFPTECALGQCDTVLISIMMASHGKMGNLRQVGNEALYWYRPHAESDTETRHDFFAEMGALRNLLTMRYMR